MLLVLDLVQRIMKAPAARIAAQFHVAPLGLSKNTATLATFFGGRDAENPDAEMAGAKEISDLQAEIAALRTALQALLQRSPED
jgi:hypothetical protein